MGIYGLNGRLWAPWAFMGTMGFMGVMGGAHSNVTFEKAGALMSQNSPSRYL